MSKKVRVMAVGTFDILHPGHIFYLTQAKKLGSELVVVISRDSVVEREKRKTILPENYRLKMVEALKPVDKVVLGNLGDMYEIVRKIKPNVIALGYDSKCIPKHIQNNLKRRGIKNVKVVRLTKYKSKFDSTTKIIRKIKNIS